MSAEYTPTTEEVRLDYVTAYTDQKFSQLLAGMAFDRWLAVHDRAVKADTARQIRDEILDRGIAVGSSKAPGPPIGHPGASREGLQQSV